MGSSGMIAQTIQLALAPVTWPVIAVVGGAVTALASWILCAGVTVLGWLAAEPGSLGGALQVGTLLWLLSNGVGVRVGEERTEGEGDAEEC